MPDSYAELPEWKKSQKWKMRTLRDGYKKASPYELNAVNLGSYRIRIRQFKARISAGYYKALQIQCGAGGGGARLVPAPNYIRMYFSKENHKRKCKLFAIN